MWSVYRLPFNFNPRSLTGATITAALTRQANVISIHAPLRERLRLRLPYSPQQNFNPRSLTGATTRDSVIAKVPAHFNPRSLTGATSSNAFTKVIICHFNPRSLTGATTVAFSHGIIYTISIHAPLRERPKAALYLSQKTHISIHAPLRERLLLLFLCRNRFLFQSTLPYGSDPLPRPLVPTAKAISIHAPLRERLEKAPPIEPEMLISIHAPLRERPSIRVSYSKVSLFQSTLPYGSDRLV